MKVAIIIQARTGSTRLVNKMLKPFYRNQTILQIIIENLKREIALPIILATTQNPNDDCLEQVAIENDIFCFRGSEDDVLQRFIDAAQQYHVNVVIRVCADNPFLNPSYILHLIKLFYETKSDYISFKTRNGIPTIKTHYGFFAELVTISALGKISELTSEKIFHEHVTNFIYANTDLFKVNLLSIPFEENDSIRLTIDTLEDFIIAQNIYKELKKESDIISPEIVVAYLKQRKEYFEQMQKQIQLQQK
jgi:spore coat polysaccharide biosynthesis protein SpsF (cytidylyltransferase family)